MITHLDMYYRIMLNLPGLIINSIGGFKMKIVIILVLSLLSSHIDKYAQAEEIAAFKTDAKSGIIYPVNKSVHLRLCLCKERYPPSQ